ncbi:hypothetical protein ACP4OV_014724 [Aristida adscensionis]
MAVLRKARTRPRRLGGRRHGCDGGTQEDTGSKHHSRLSTTISAGSGASCDAQHQCWLPELVVRLRGFSADMRSLAREPALMPVLSRGWRKARRKDGENARWTDACARDGADLRGNAETAPGKEAECEMASARCLEICRAEEPNCRARIENDGFGDSVAKGFLFHIQKLIKILPPCYRTEEEAKRYASPPRGPVRRYLTLEEQAATGLLRRGEDELAVAELLTVGPAGGEVLLLRAGEWRRLPVAAGGGGGKLPSSWSTHTTLPVGDALLCWANPHRGLILADVLAARPTLRHVPFPAEAARPASGPAASRDVRATADGKVRFVNVSPRCCCGGAGATHCRSSRHAYTITTWTLRMADMAWVMDAMVDATELWRLDAHASVPRDQPARAVVSLDDPDAVSFLVCKRSAEEYGDDTLWVIVVDVRRKTLRSVSLHPGTQQYIVWERVFPSTISGCFNSSPSTGASARRKAGTRRPSLSRRSSSTTTVIRC